MRDPDDTLLFRSELLAGERLLWAGRPHPPTAARAGWPIIPFGLFWTALSVTGVAGAWREGDMAGVAFLSPFFAIGALMLSAPPLG